MSLDALLDRLATTTPLWAIALLLVAACAVACELGFQAYAWLLGAEQQRKRRGGRDASDEGLIIAAALGLLALLIGFTFTVTLQRFQQREAALATEASAISTNWREARAAGSAAGDALALQVAAYLDARVAQFTAGNAGLAHGPAALPAEAARRALWPLTEAAIAPLRTTPLAVALLASTEATVSTAIARDALFAAHLPGRALLLLIGHLLLTAFILGHVFGESGNRHRTATTVLFVVIAAAIVLVLDLDRPFDGGLELDAMPLKDLQAEMRTAPPRYAVETATRR